MPSLVAVVDGGGIQVGGGPGLHCISVTFQGNMMSVVHPRLVVHRGIQVWNVMMSFGMFYVPCHVRGGIDETNDDGMECRECSTVARDAVNIFLLPFCLPLFMFCVCGGWGWQQDDAALCCLTKVLYMIVMQVMSDICQSNEMRTYQMS